MNISQKDLKTLWRAPLMWLTLALMTFISFWFLWQMVDKYISLQANFAALPNPPNITTALWIPYLMLMAKLMMLIIAFTSSFTIAQEKGQQTLWYLLINRQSYGYVIAQKIKAQTVILWYVLMMLGVTLLLLSQGGELNWSLVIAGVIGLLLFVLWLIALGILISTFSQSSATAFLASVVAYTLLWMLGGEGVAQEYGVNWLHLLSPAHHLRWLTQGELSLSSMIYFVVGAWFFLALAAHKVGQTKS